MIKLRVSNSPVSWGVDYADHPGNPPWKQVMDEIVEAGYEWTEPGPIGYYPEDPDFLRTEFEKRGQRVSGSFIFEAVYRQEDTQNLREITHRACRLLAPLGAKYLVIVPHVVPERLRVAGRSAEAPRLEGDEWKTFIELVGKTGQTIADEYGLTAAIHAHVGTYLEFPDEIEHALEDLDPDSVQLCLDSGHSAYAGFNPVDFYLKHADRIQHLHFKDIDREIHQRVIQDKLDFHTAVRIGVFCQLGKGVVDFSSLKQALEQTDYSGFATIEQDRDPEGRTDPLTDAIENLAFLRKAGLVTQ